MPQVIRMPFRGSGTLGRGVNTLTGEFVGKALNVLSKEQTVSGQEAFYDVQITETHDALMKSMGLSVEASGRYGMFSAGGKFELSEKASFNAASTFVVASCRVQNAFEMVDRVELLPEAKPVMEDPERFKTAFGTSFVRGLQTGGELYVVLQVTSTDSAIQNSLSASFHAECQGLLASGGFGMEYGQAMAQRNQMTKVSVLMYQRAGQDENLSYISAASEIIRRLKEFPAIARANPCGFECEVADYNTLALPEVNEEEIADREMALTDCARLRLKFMTRRNDIEFARENRDFYDDLPTDADLGDAWEKYSRAVGLVQLHAQKIAGRKIAPTVFDLSAVDPNLDLPFISFKRVNAPSNVPVPDFLSGAWEYKYAKRKLEELGFKCEGDGKPIEESSKKPRDIVTGQSPAPGMMVSPGSPVRLTYNYVPSKRFSWALSEAVIRPNLAAVVAAKEKSASPAKPPVLRLPTRK